MTSMGIVAKQLHDLCDEKQTVFVTLPKTNTWKRYHQIQNFKIHIY